MESVPDHTRSRLVEILNQHCNYDLYNKVITLCDALADAVALLRWKED